MLEWLTECSGDGEEGWGSMLWCGLGDGRVRVFSLDTLTVEEVYVQAKDRVVRLTLPCNRSLDKITIRGHSSVT